MCLVSGVFTKRGAGCCLSSPDVSTFIGRNIQESVLLLVDKIWGLVESVVSVTQYYWFNDIMLSFQWVDAVVLATQCYCSSDMMLLFQ